MPILEKYRHYFDIDPDYFPAVNEAVINSKPEMWKKFFPHDTFVRLVKNTVSVLDRKQMLKITVCRSELPSITSQNKEFLEYFQGSEFPVVSIKDIDEIKHHGKYNYDYQQTKLPIHLTKELDVISEVLDKIKEKLASGTISKAIMIADHGASRLAVIHETETVWEMPEKGEHSGRCCLKSEIDETPAYEIRQDKTCASLSEG